MESRIDGFSRYVGKIGVDNFLLILVGVLYLAAYYQTQRDHADTDLHWRTAVFFLGYGFLYDLFRINVLRFSLLLHTQNYWLFRSLLLFLFLLFLYDGLFHALFEQWKRAHWK